MKYDVFISYSSRDIVEATKLCDYLEGHGINCFLAGRDIPKHRVWADVLVEALEESAMMVVLFSKNFNESDEVSRELEIMAKNKCPIYTFRLSDCPFRGAKKYYLENRNWIDAFPIPDKAYPALVADIEQNLSHSSTIIDASARNSISVKTPSIVSESPQYITAFVKKQEPMRTKPTVFQRLEGAKKYKRWIVGLAASAGFVACVIAALNTLIPKKSSLVTNEAPSMLKEQCLDSIEGGESSQTIMELSLPADVVIDDKDVQKTLSKEEVQNTTKTPEIKKCIYEAYGVSFGMVYVASGTFTMGASTGQEDAYEEEMPAHKVTLASFSIGETEVTQALWRAVMGSNPSNNVGDTFPVENVSWNDCDAFIKKLNSITGKQFTLPTEAQWEYAARGGGKSHHYKYSGGNNVADIAWYIGNSNRSTHVVATRKPNELGLYDMSGNVGEWCQDIYAQYTSQDTLNPTVVMGGEEHVIRGGDCKIQIRGCRVTYRSSNIPSAKDATTGLRLALN